jgi:site-specific DNA-methyltransferase (adenine-specific)
MANGRYQIIYADPPWKYDDSRTSKSMGMARSAYECMPVKEIMALPVKQISDRNCLLFLWATPPKLREAIAVIDVWGFRYITIVFTWVKLNPRGKVEKEGKDIILRGGIYSGLGHWTNANTELVLLGKRGHPKRIARNVKQIIIAPRREHSRKPDETREKIIQLVGGLPRVELFARQRVEGWDVWGNEVESDIDLANAGIEAA